MDLWKLKKTSGDEQNFGDKAQQQKAATIDFLTEEVVSFITTHNLKNDYVIKETQMINDLIERI